MWESMRVSKTDMAAVFLSTFHEQTIALTISALFKRHSSNITLPHAPINPMDHGGHDSISCVYVLDMVRPKMESQRYVKQYVRTRKTDFEPTCCIIFYSININNSYLSSLCIIAKIF